MSNPPFTQSKMLMAPGFKHAFFGREGGVSDGVYFSLNAGPGSRDEADAVAENRRRIAGALGVTSDRLLSLYQIHSAKAVTASAPFTIGGDRPQADALVSATPGLALTILTADCGPVLLADPQAKIIGAAHAGWKGALGGVLEAVVQAMTSLGAHTDNMVAAIGPCIGQASYEVGPEFLDVFLKSDEENERFFKGGQGDRLHFDLKGYCAARLFAAGLRHVDILPQDTRALESAYFSNRRAVKRQEGDYGRNLSAIVLQD